MTLSFVQQIGLPSGSLLQIGLGARVNSQSKLKIQYNYGTTDNNGNVQFQTIAVPGVAHTFNQTYTCDALNRLSNAEETYNSMTKWEQEFSYDRYGNRRFIEAPTTTLPKNCLDGSTPIVCTADVPIVNPEIAANNKLTGSIYDASGNITEDGNDWTFVYDGENKQVEATTNAPDTVGEYSYDGDGRRVKKHNPLSGETTVFVYDAGGMLIAEYDTTIQTGSNAKIAYTTVDRLGSPRINTSATGSVIARHDYHPFGEEVATAERTSGVGYQADTIRKKFTGYERDEETGLDYAQARYFNSGHGRFSTADPLQSSAIAANPQTLNRYVYVASNPLNFTDSTGMFIEAWSHGGFLYGVGLNMMSPFMEPPAASQGPTHEEVHATPPPAQTQNQVTIEGGTAGERAAINDSLEYLRVQSSLVDNAVREFEGTGNTPMLTISIMDDATFDATYNVNGNTGAVGAAERSSAEIDTQPNSTNENAPGRYTASVTIYIKQGSINLQQERADRRAGRETTLEAILSHEIKTCD